MDYLKQWENQAHGGPGQFDWQHFVGKVLLMDVDGWLIFSCGCAVRASDHAMRHAHGTLQALRVLKATYDDIGGIFRGLTEAV